MTDSVLVYFQKSQLASRTTKLLRRRNATVFKYDYRSHGGYSGLSTLSSM
jgi:hypothetical protein